MLEVYFKNLYQRAVQNAYKLASQEVATALSENGVCLDCGSSDGYRYEKLHCESGITKDRYHGIDWEIDSVAKARANGLNVIRGDLNKQLPYKDEKFDCVFGFSVIEHLLNPCHFVKECHRILVPGGKLVLLTPNISTYFTALLILAGRMPSSGPHPDSEYLVNSQEVCKVSSESLISDAESTTPAHRHLVVFSYSTLEKFLKFEKFNNVQGHGFGLYPLPNFTQPLMEKLDPYHCHQMVFTAER